MRVEISHPLLALKVLELDKPEVTLGRGSHNDIDLDDARIDARHARILLKDGWTIVLDLLSTDGVRINGQRIHSPWCVGAEDLISIGGYTLTVVSATQGSHAARWRSSEKRDK